MSNETALSEIMKILPPKMEAFLDTLTVNELNKLGEIDPELLAKIYQVRYIRQLQSLL